MNIRRRKVVLALMTAAVVITVRTTLTEKRVLLNRESPKAEILKTIGTLKPHPYPVVPKIAHFTLVGSLRFQFYHLVCLISVYRVVKPHRMLFHTDNEPKNNEFWEEAKRIPILEVIHWPTPDTVFNNTLSNAWHMSDVLRSKVLVKYGGFYCDLDFWFIRPVDHLFHYDFVVNDCGGGMICSSMFFTRNTSLIMNLYYENYKNYKPGCFLCYATEALARLVSEHPESAHIEKGTLKSDNWTELYLHPMNWSKPRYSILFYFRERRRFGFPLVDRENIKTMNNTVGEIARYIYYGQADPIGINDTFTQWFEQPQEIQVNPFINNPTVIT